jgi:hypothetical protein
VELLAPFGLYLPSPLFRAAHETRACLRLAILIVTGSEKYNVKSVIEPQHPGVQPVNRLETRTGGRLREGPLQPDVVLMYRRRYRQSVSMFIQINAELVRSFNAPQAQGSKII